MKYNLKNRPQVGWFDRNIDAWFKGFEAELRKLIRQKRKDYLGLRSGTFLEEIQLLKEILGE